MQKELKYSEVFVPGGFPRHTYNPRLELGLENDVAEVLDNLCKLVVVTGHTKSGKTVLVRNVFSNHSPIWLDGGAVSTEEDLWSSVLGEVGGHQRFDEQSSQITKSQVSAKGKAGANFFVAKGEAEIGGSIGSDRGHSSATSRSISSRVAALNGLRTTRRPLVIDDFHYLGKELQGSLVRALKPLIFDGVPVVIIAIPHRRYDSLKVEREMTGRIRPVEIPSWSDTELKFIPVTGFRLLNGKLPDTLPGELAHEAIGSPHLMQEFCRAICRYHEISTSFNGATVEIDSDQMAKVFRTTAETIGRPIFEKLAKGPRQRSDRIERNLANGGTTDIYGLVLRALASLKPGLITLEYEDLRSAIREVSAQNPPQLQEVARVLKHMSEIAATDQSSTPVIDFDEGEKRLHITDPFFAFFLRFGELEI